MTIMRLWHGEVPVERADEYERFMIDRAVPDYGSVDGLIKLYFQRRNEDTTAHFLLVTLWESLEAVTKFAGSEPGLAKYYPEDDDFLLKKEKYTTMYNVFYEK